MKLSRLIGLISLLLVVCASADSFAQERRGSYVLIKPGAFIPANDLDREGFDTSFSGEVCVGTHMLPYVAVEAGAGYYQTRASIEGTNFGVSEVSVLPLTATLKGVVPFFGAELYAGGGPGVYFTEIEIKGNGPTTTSHPAVFGGHILLGATVDVLPRVFIGGEAKYIFTARAHFLDSEMKLDGIMTSLVMGFRF